MPTVEQLLKQHEMGQAYISITDELGPDPQLIAFVNYDSFAGFESLDMFSQHLEILDQIKNDNSFELACENLQDQVNKIAGMFKKGGNAAIGTALSAWFVALFVPGGGQAVHFITKIGAIGVVAALGGHVIEKATETPENEEVIAARKAALVYPVSSYNNLVEQFDKLFKYELEVASGIPDNFDVSSWKSYRDKAVGSPTYKFFMGHSKKAQAYGVSLTTSFADSKWNATYFSNAVKWLKENSEETRELSEKYSDKMEKINNWLKSNNLLDKDNKKVVGYISETLGISVGVFKQCGGILLEVKKVLENVSHHFQETK